MTMKTIKSATFRCFLYTDANHWSVYIQQEESRDTFYSKVVCGRNDRYTDRIIGRLYRQLEEVRTAQDLPAWEILLQVYDKASVEIINSWLEREMVRRIQG